MFRRLVSRSSNLRFFAPRTVSLSTTTPATASNGFFDSKTNQAIAAAASVVVSAVAYSYIFDDAREDVRLLNDLIEANNGNVFQALPAIVSYVKSHPESALLVEAFLLHAESKLPDEETKKFLRGVANLLVSPQSLQKPSESVSYDGSLQFVVDSYMQTHAPFSLSADVAKSTIRKARGDYSVTQIQTALKERHTASAQPSAAPAAAEKAAEQSHQQDPRDVPIQQIDAARRTTHCSLCKDILLAEGNPCIQEGYRFSRCLGYYSDKRARQAKKLKQQGLPPPSDPSPEDDPCIDLFMEVLNCQEKHQQFFDELYAKLKQRSREEEMKAMTASQREALSFVESLSDDELALLFDSEHKN